MYFTKLGDARFFSHLDVMRTMDRALRRSGLPIRFTEGMNPKVRMSFPTALPLGMESRLEVMEIQVRPGPTLREVCERLGAELPESMRPFDVDALFKGEKWRVVEISYDVFADAEEPPSDAVIEALLAREAVPVERRGKELDLRPLLARVLREDTCLRVDIAWTEKGTARPEDLLRALGRDPENHRSVKVGITFESSFGERIRKTNGT